MVNLDKKCDSKIRSLSDIEELKAHSVILAFLILLAEISAYIFDVPGIVMLIGTIILGAIALNICLNYFKFCFGRLFEDKSNK